jgi:hypothetical protein
VARPERQGHEGWGTVAEFIRRGLGAAWRPTELDQLERLVRLS